MDKDSCNHENQHYSLCHSIYGCYSFNTCNDCGRRLSPSIEKAEEAKNE